MKREKDLQITERYGEDHESAEKEKDKNNVDNNWDDSSIMWMRQQTVIRRDFCCRCNADTAGAGNYGNFYEGGGNAGSGADFGGRNHRAGCI